VVLLTKGKLIGQGATASVFQWGENEVIKLFDSKVPADLIEIEYSTSFQIQNLQVPSPRVKDLIELDGQKGIIYEWIDGKSLTKLLAINPIFIAKHAKLFSKLHRQVHQTDATSLPKQKEYLKRNIHLTSLLTPEEKQLICAFLDELPEGTQLLHGDFHPDNILITDKKVTIIDWMTAVCGNPLGDIARTNMILQYGYLPKSMPAPIRFMVGLIRRRLCRIYLQEYRRLLPFNHEELEKWTLPVMAARLIEHLHPDEKNVLLENIRILSKKYL
jgi:uncharacterized protein (TIGR02172 family)